MLKGNEAAFEEALQRMYDHCKAEVQGYAGASYIRPTPGPKSNNEYTVSSLVFQN